MMPEHWILLFDPFKNILNTYRMILEGEKYLVETASNSEEVFHRFSLRRYAVFVTEYVDPLEDTYRIIQWVKKHASETYILMVTDTEIDNITYETLFDIGMDDFLLKPYPPQKILAHIKKGLRQRDFIIKKQEVERQSLLDPVAQQIQQPVFNPAYFRKCLRQELKKSRRHQHPLSLLLMRIPSEERVGDQFERFCAELAKILRSYTREEDMVGRENGNFGILLPETDEAGSQALVKRLTHLIQGYPIFQSDEFLKPIIETLSFQVFTYPEKFVIPESLRAILEEVNSERPRH